MDATQQFNVTVQGVKNKYVFQATARMRGLQEDQDLPAEFYTDHNVEVPDGDHWEMVLAQSPVWGKEEPGIMHIHLHPDRLQSFVCFIYPLKTADEAHALFRMWCLGTVYSIEHNEDFATTAEDHADDFEDYFNTEFSIKIAKS